MGAIKAITFDLWDTLVIDDSDEAKRAEQGLRSKFDERRHLLWEALNADGPIDLETVCLAYSVGDAAFNKVWKEHHITWPIAERLRVILRGLGRELPDAAFDAVVRAHGEMEVEIPPDAIPGGAAVLERLAKRYKLCIVSDAIVSPGSCLRRLLENHGLAKPFSRVCLLRRGRPQQAAPLDVRLGGGDSLASRSVKCCTSVTATTTTSRGRSGLG